MSKISEQDVRQIAALARLDLTDSDIKKYQAELSGIFEYVDQIEKVNTKDVAPTGQVTGLVDVFREDVKNPSTLSREEILMNAPEKKDGYIKVKSILE